MTSFPFRAALAATFLLAAAAAAAEPALTSSPTAAPPAAPALVATSTAGPAAGKPGVAGPRLESVLKECSSRTFWQANYPVPVLDRTLVTQSLDDARTYLQRQQRDDGLFNGDYDIPTKQRLERPGAAVQAHALWALIRGDGRAAHGGGHRLHPTRPERLFHRHAPPGRRPRLRRAGLRG